MRTRGPILMVLCVLASLLVPGIASASTAASAETRVWAFDLANQLRVGGSAALTLDLCRGCEPTYDELASDSLLAARGGRGAVNVTSGGRTVDEALTTGQRFVGEGAQEVGPGVFRSADGTRQFRMTDADITGSHGKIGPHVHFEKFDPVTGEKIKNIHTPLKDQ